MTAGQIPTMLAGFGQGFQHDTSDTSTDCFATTFTTVHAVNSLVASAVNISVDTWAVPIQRTAEISVELTNMWTVCKTTNFAKQMSTRLSTMSGVLDMASTAGMAIAIHYIQGIDTPLFTAGNDYLTADSCGKTANALARILQYTLNYEVPNEFYAEMLSVSLADQMLM